MYDTSQIAEDDWIQGEIQRPEEEDRGDGIAICKARVPTIIRLSPIESE